MGSLRDVAVLNTMSLMDHIARLGPLRVQGAIRSIRCRMKDIVRHIRHIHVPIGAIDARRGKGGNPRRGHARHRVAIGGERWTECKSRISLYIC